MGNKLFRLLALILFPLFTATAQAADDVSSFSLNLNTVNDIQLAKSYWLGGADIGLTFKGDDGSTICRAMGYTTASCTPPLSISKTCSYDKSYHMCGCDSAIYRYNDENCPYGSVPNADVCDGFSRGCDCEESGYVWDDTTGLCIFSCTSDSDCPTGEVCDTSDGQCYECLQSIDCGEGYDCVNHQCKEVDLCDGVQCDGDLQCNPQTGSCECMNGGKDLNGRCVECISNGDCPKFCSSENICVDCLKDSDCGSGNWSCNQGQCQMEEDPCATVLCEGGTCTDGICTCPGDLKEINGVCKCETGHPQGTSCVECTQNSHCGSGYCGSNNTCVECLNDRHCDSSKGEKCVSDGTCQTTDLCYDAADRCPVDSTCNSSSGACSCPGDLTDINNVCDCASGYKKNTSCVECLNDSHCGDANQWACQNNSCVNLCANVTCTGGTCVRGDCQCPGDLTEINGVCKCETGHPKGNSCVECTQNSHCGNTDQWACQNNSCVNLCANVSCTNGTCVRGDCQCPGDLKEINGVCKCETGHPKGNSCVECTEDSHCGDNGKCNTSSNSCEAKEERSQCYQKIVAKGYLAAETTEELKEILTTNYGDYPDLMVYILGPIEIDNIDFTSIGIGTASLTLSDTYMALSENICTTQDLMNDKMQQPSLTVTGNLEVQGFMTTQLANLSIANLNIPPTGYLTSTRVHRQTIPLTIENVNFNGGRWSIASADTVTNMPYIVQIENLTASTSAESDWVIEKGAVTINELNENFGWLEITMPNTSHLNITSLNMLGSYLSIGSDSLVDIEKTKLTGGSIASITLNGTRMNMAEAEIADRSQFNIIMKYGSKFYDLSNEEGRPIGKYVLQPGMQFTVDNSTSTYENCLYNYYGSSHLLQEFCTPNSRYNALYNGLKLFLRFNSSGKTGVSSYYTCKYTDWNYAWKLGSYTQNGQGKWTDNWGCTVYVWGDKWY